MLTGKYRRIYYYHLKKCGGSTLNQWLDTLTFDDRANDPRWAGAWLFGDLSLETAMPRAEAYANRARSVFHWSDVVHSHAAMRQYVPPNTFSLTMLRDPVARLVSQVSDWRRLRPEDAANQKPHIQTCVADAKNLSLTAFLQKHAYTDGRTFLNNYMTRALAAGRIGRLVLDIDDAERLLEVALQSLEQDYDFVGLTESFDLSRNAFCGLLGIPPAKRIPTVNKTVKPDFVDDGTRQILDDLTGIDRRLYARACALFDQRHRALAEAYDTETFESLHASRLLSEQRGHYDHYMTRYSVRAPLIGTGFHGRDGAGLPSCAVWTGPETCATLYMPIPPHQRVVLAVWIRGYASASQRAQLRVRVDGRPAHHRFETIEGYADRLLVEAESERDFVRLDLEVDETVASGERGTSQHDPRLRGIAFDSYGWRNRGPEITPGPTA